VVAAIVGRNVERLVPSIDVRTDAKAVVAVRDLVAAGIGPVSFDVRPGEILGIFGVVGSGRTELMEALFGAREILGGSVDLGKGSFVPKTPSHASSQGFALVPSDRLRKSMFPSLTSGDNLLASCFGDLGVGAVRRRPHERGLFEGAAHKLNLQPRRIDLEARRFSGGNQQKLVIGRWLNDVKNCRVLLLDEPTQGVDVGARSDIYAALRSVTAGGDRAVIATSSEPEELMQIANRVIILSHGRIAGIIEGKEVTENNLLALAHA
jgi:ribose transport system ATP-binding protein